MNPEVFEVCNISGLMGLGEGFSRLLIVIIVDIPHPALPSCRPSPCIVQYPKQGIQTIRRPYAKPTLFFLKGLVDGGCILLDLSFSIQELCRDLGSRVQFFWFGRRFQGSVSREYRERAKAGGSSFEAPSILALHPDSLPSALHCPKPETLDVIPPE